MADTTKKTTVVLEAQAKNFSQVRREVRSVFKELDPEEANEGFQMLMETIEGTFKSLDEVAESMRGLVGEMSSLGDVTNEFAAMTAGIEDLTDAISKMSAAKKRDAGIDDQRARRRSFGMGVMQGMGIGEYFPERGLGMNVMGRGVGNAVRAAGSATIGSAFHGVGGVVQGLNAIPVVGGLFGGQLQSSMQAAQEALGYEQVRGSLARFGFSMAGQTRTGASQADEDAAVQRALDIDLIERTMRGARSTQTAPRRTAEDKFGALYAGAGERLGPVATRTAEESAAIERRTRAEVQAGRGYGPETQFQMMSRVGVGFGLGAPAAAQFGGSILETAGGGASQLSAQNFALALGLDKRFGVGADATGAFLRGGRTGAAGGISGEDAAVRALQAAVSLGLEGSDLTNYMRETASALMQFDQTGIPIDVSSLASMQRSVAVSGFGTMQGARVGRQLRDVGAQIGNGGPQNAAQMLMFRQLFGYGGGGVDDFFQASLRASNGQFVEGGFQKMLGSVMQGRGADSAEKNALFLQQALSQMGINIGLQQAYDVARGDTRAISEAETTIAAGMGAAGTMNASSIAAMGRAATPGVSVTQAALENERLGAGGRMLPAMQEFEKAQTAMMRNASEFGNVVKSLAETAKGISKFLGPGAENLARVLEELANRAGM